MDSVRLHFKKSRPNARGYKLQAEPAEESSPPSPKMKPVVLLLLILLAHQALQLYQDTFPTLAGDNLYATPWQRWTRGRFTIRSISRAGKILHCAATRDEACSRDQVLYKRQAEVLRLQEINSNSSSNTTTSCPRYFDWIDKDLRPWNSSGITKWSLDAAARSAAFRVLVVDGKLYVKHYYSCHTSRSMFTVWGLLMLLERFPAQVADVDLLFNCGDKPRVTDTSWFTPPIFSFSTLTNNRSLDIPFPDWSFWGWPDMGIDSWAEESSTIAQNAEQVPWRRRKPVAHWKGDPYSSRTRVHLSKCKTPRLDFQAQDWKQETKSNFANSQRSKQCNYRYKVYAEGNAWSVSYKYIMACGSTMLNIAQEYQDFFTRALVPWIHFVPVSSHPNGMCSSIEAAVEWGNKYPKVAERIARQARDFITTDLSIDRVYDYMYHVLQRYAKLQRFKVMVPRDAEWVCPSYVKCIALASQQKQLNRLEAPAPARPCTMQ